MIKKIAAAALLSVVGASSSSASSLVAGWDFSQYSTDFGQVLTIDNATQTNTLRSNYSSLDPTGGLGAESAPFGLMTLPFVPVGDGSEAFLPVIGSLGSGLTIPTPNQYDSASLLALEGQAFTTPLRMAAYASVSIVFEADLTSVPQVGSNWTLAFGAQILPGTNNSAITVEFSTDGQNWTGVGSANVNTVDTAFSFALGAAQSDRGFVRLGFQPGASIDNVSILADLTTVPEPAVASLLAAGLLGLARFGRRRA